MLFQLPVEVIEGNGPPGKQKIMKQQIVMQNIKQVGLPKATELRLIRQHYSLKIIPSFL